MDACILSVSRQKKVFGTTFDLRVKSTGQLGALLCRFPQMFVREIAKFIGDTNASGAVPGIFVRDLRASVRDVTPSSRDIGASVRDLTPSSRDFALKSRTVALETREEALESRIEDLNFRANKTFSRTEALKSREDALVSRTEGIKSRTDALTSRAEIVVSNLNFPDLGSKMVRGSGSAGFRGDFGVFCVFFGTGFDPLGEVPWDFGETSGRFWETDTSFSGL